MPIPKIMSAAVVEKFREPLVMRELPVPTPGPGQALVEIMAMGFATLICTRLTAIEDHFSRTGILDSALLAQQ